MDRQWYLVQCKPRESFRAELHLNNQGFVCFHPTHFVKRKRLREFQSVIEPLFPHYLFILLDKTSNWIPIRSTRGVARIVHFNGRPASLDDAFISQLKLRCDKLHGKESEPMYKINDRVRITDGCFKDIEAIVTATSGDERVTLLFDLMNRPQEIEVDCRDLEVV